MQSHSAQIRELLDRVRARWRRASLFRAVVRAALASAAVLAVALLFTLLTSRAPATLAALGVVAVVLSIAAAVWGLWPIGRSPSDAQVARFIEEQEPALDDRLASAVDLLADGRPETAGLAGPMVADAARRASAIDPSTVVPGPTLRRRGAQAAAAAAILLAVMFAGRDRARESLDALSLTLFPSRLSLDVTPGSVRLRPGASLTIDARLLGNRAPVVARVLRVDGEDTTPTDAEAWRAIEMTPTRSGAFTLAIGSIGTSFRYRVVAGAVTSPVYDVRVVRAPRVARIDVDYTYPPTLGLPARTEEDGGDIYAPAGTAVRVRVRADRDASSGRLTFADGTALDLASGSDRTLSGSWKVVANGSYRVALADREGLGNAGDTEYFIRTIEDRPPDVRITRPARDRTVTPLEEVDVEAQADDDFGIDRIELVYAVRGGAERSVPIDVPRRETSVTGTATIYLEDLHVAPGDFVSYYVRARDLARGRRSTEARSDIFFLEVKPFEQVYTASESQEAGGGGGSPELDDLVSAQKQVIVATWKLDRRAETAGGARSEQDIQSVGRAEAELKTRVEETSSSFRASSMRDPRRGQQSGRGAPPAGAPRAGQTTPQEDAMTAAAAALGKAVDSLTRLKTGEAITPELEALDHLLKAQGETKQRQVAPQQVGTGGGNRSGQDMSSLFDRELQRQQQTNYETPTTTEQRPDATAGLLDKIKELAQRQDELVRRQRELAEARPQMTKEDVTRELEKLTREQTELRQRAEDLSRQMAGQGQQNQSNQQGQQRQQGPQSQSGQQNASSGQGQQSQPGQGQSGQQRGASGQNAASSGQQSSGGQGGRQMRDVSDEMRNAAGDLRRQDPEQASERGSRALEKLRAIERQMQASAPDERRRARGDMQLEARQLADAERQLENELGRLGQSDAAKDAMRRLAGEQERLAERAEQLQQGLGRQAATGGDAKESDRTTEQAVAEASREFDRQRVDERMQQSAETLRAAAEADGKNGAKDGTPGRPSAAQMARAQEELARALDKLADQLANASAPADDDSRKLSDQLGRAQELRERIDELTRRIEQLGQPSGAQAQPGDPSGQGSPSADRGASLEELRLEYTQQLQETRDLLDELDRDHTYTQGGAGFTFETAGKMTLSAPGTEAFKQDFAKWEALRRQATMALERAQLSISKKLQEAIARDRLAAGGADKPPAEYQQQVDSYFKALATGRKP